MPHSPQFAQFREKLRALAARQNAKYEFDAVAATVVVGGLDPSDWGGQARIDRLSRRAEFGQRAGKVRRRVFAAAHLACWEFETRADAQAFLGFAAGLGLTPTSLEGGWPEWATYVAITTEFADRGSAT